MTECKHEYLWSSIDRETQRCRDCWEEIPIRWWACCGKEHVREVPIGEACPACGFTRAEFEASGGCGEHARL